MKRSKNKKQGVGGRPYKWASGKIKTIRVPVAFLKQVLAFINELDRREQQRKAGKPPCHLSSQNAQTPVELSNKTCKQVCFNCPL